MSRLTRTSLFIMLTVAGCGAPTPPAEPTDLPPAYTRSLTADPKLAEAGGQFTTWAEGQRSGGQPVFSRIEVLPPTPTLSPYGVGTYQKESRLPAILTIGPGWNALKPDEREALVATAFQELTRRLEALKLAAPLRPTLTVQTPQGLELGWVNDLRQGKKLLHGDDD